MSYTIGRNFLNRGVRRSAGILLSVSLISLWAVSAHAQTVTSFEASEGFVLGQPANGVGGWAGSNSFVIDNTYAYEGTQSLRIHSTDTGELLAITGLESEGQNSLSTWFLNTAVTGAHWAYVSRYYLTLLNENEVSTTYQFAVRYHTNTDNYNLHYQQIGGDDSAVVAIADGVYKPLEWNQITFRVDSENREYNILLNGVLIVTASLLETVSSDAVVSSFNFRRSGMGTVYYDMVQIPEPGHVALALGGMMGIVWLVYRRRVRLAQ